MSIGDFEGYIRTNACLTLDDARDPERLSYAFGPVITAGRAYAVEKDSERMYRRKHPEQFLSDEEWGRALGEA
jgi:hypothetical protein